MKLDEESLVSSMGAAVRALVHFAETQGIDVDPIIAASGIDRALLDDPRARLPHVPSYALFEGILAASDDPLMHLRAAPHIPFGAFRIIDFVARSAATAGDGLTAVARYFCIVHQGARMTIESEAGEHRFIFGTMSGPGNGAFTLAITATRFTHLCGAGLRPMRTELIRGPLEDPALARTLYGEHIVYGAARDMIVYSPAQWATPMPTIDPMLYEVLEQHAENLKETLEREVTLPELVARALQVLLGHGRPELRHVARRLGMSPRSLQRKLRAGGTSFQAVLDDTRRALAERYLRDRSLTVLEVAFMLGYADESAFHRAFRRWHDQRPGAWRVEQPPG